MPGPFEPPLQAALLMPAWLGDAVMATALIEPLAELTANPIQIWCRPAHKSLLASHPAVGEVLEYDPKGRHRGAGGLRSFRRDIAAAQLSPDAVWILPDSFSAALAARASGVRRRVGRSGQGRRFLISDPIPDLPRRQRHWVEEQEPLLGPLADEQWLARRRPLLPRVEIETEALARLDERLSGHGVALDEACVFVAGATYGPAKRWRGFEGLAKLLPSVLTPILVGDTSEGGYLGELAEAIRAAGRVCLDFSGQLDLPELAALLSRARFTVSNDTGPMHLAAAVGGRVFGLFLSTDPVWTAPRGPRVRSMRADIDCSPCFERSCPLPEMLCQDRIEPWVLHGALADWLQIEIRR